MNGAITEIPLSGGRAICKAWVTRDQLTDHKLIGDLVISLGQTVRAWGCTEVTHDALVFVPGVYHEATQIKTDDHYEMVARGVTGDVAAP